MSVKPKHDRAAYAALRTEGLSNRQIADRLGVNESTVRRTLGKQDAPAKPKVLRKVTVFVIEEYVG